MADKSNRTLCIRRNTYDANHRPLNKTWCGRPIDKSENVFATIDSAIVNRLFLGRMTVCNKCWDAIETIIARDKQTQEGESNA